YHGGMADWDKIMKALRDIGYTGDLTFEAGNYLKSLPKELYPAGAEMMVTVGKYLRGIYLD
ncbi:MAG: sugar phosphate isomerase/epimerase, partial [Eubacteriales bacterium]|nr:sugar phosphate isomerase/epimerase [Eubacteriales bacterium]